MLMESAQQDFWANETVAFLALASMSNVGFWSLHKVAASGSGFKELLKTDSPDRLNKVMRNKLPDVDPIWSIYREKQWEKGLKLHRTLSSQDIRLIFRDHPDFPAALKNIPDAPYWIFVQGDLNSLNQNAVSIVGTRDASQDGGFLTKWVVSALVDTGVVTVSGLATGIDQCAHKESIRFGIPTVAVLGTGILNNYPAGSDVLRRSILEHGGAIVSEYLPNQSYSGENFVRRNRLQAALCHTLVPVEWKIKSGTAHTVEFAFKYGKRIANVYLPNTYDQRTELAFAHTHRAAEAFQVPHDIKEFVDYAVLHPAGESATNSDPVEIQQGFDFKE